MVPDRGHGGYRRVVAAALGYLSKASTLTVTIVAAIAAGSIFLGVSLKPGQPNLTRYRGFEKQQPGYQPGGTGCDPSRLERLPIPSREAADERDRCFEAGEDYRLKANDLIQQTRSADAAEVIVGLTYQQALIAVAGLIMGFLTMVAAIAAAYYARRAAMETQRGADAADAAARAATRANERSQELFIADQRPWVHVDIIVDRPIIWNPEGCDFIPTFVLENVGKTPALNVDVFMKVLSMEVSMSPKEEQAAFAEEETREASGVVRPIFAGKSYKFFCSVSIPNDILGRSVDYWHYVRGDDADCSFPLIVGCVNYRSGFDDEVHQTPFIFTLTRGEGDDRPLISPPSGRLMPHELFVQHWHPGSGAGEAGQAV